jgi:tRNA U34 5-methylaminomethyl-2-thiouridine-forming methyltransferase MnmC
MHQAKNKKFIRIFELGMGTGLNVYLTALAAAELNVFVEMQSIEAFPITVEEAKPLNYPECLGQSELLFKQIHALSWGELHPLSPNFSLKKIHAKIQDVAIESTYDLIYFDAFAPEKQEEMWTEVIFKKLYDALISEGTLVTYCVKGVVRRRLIALGFEVEKLKGPIGGKREILRAVKRGGGL